MNKLVALALLAPIVLMAGCASRAAMPSSLTPSALLADPDRFEGREVTVTGIMESGAERYRIWDGDQPRGGQALVDRCIGLAIRRDTESDKFDQRSVTIRGVFRKAVEERIVVLGGCNNRAVIYVEAISQN